MWQPKFVFEDGYQLFNLDMEMQWVGSLLGFGLHTKPNQELKGFNAHVVLLSCRSNRGPTSCNLVLRVLRT